jgi:hypothetical protein
VSPLGAAASGKFPFGNPSVDLLVELICQSTHSTFFLLGISKEVEDLIQENNNLLATKLVEFQSVGLLEGEI